MRKFALIISFLFVFVSSCSLDDEASTTFYLEVVPIESVAIPAQFVYGETYEISVTYIRPNLCYEFNDFVYEIDGHSRTVAVLTTVYTNLNCIEQTEEATATFDFTVHDTETYLFKFFQGQDEQGVDQYHLVEVPVVVGKNTGGK